MTRFHFERPDGPPSNTVQHPSTILNPLIPPQGFPVGGGQVELFAQALVPVGGSQTALKFNNLDSSPGTKMYVVSNIGDRIDQYTLNTAFDLSDTLTFANKTFFIPNSIPPPFETVPTGMAWSDTGSFLFIVGDSSQIVIQYPASTAFDLSTVSTTNEAVTLGAQAPTPTGLFFGDNGNKLFIPASTPGEINQFTLNSPYTLQAGSTHDGSFSLTSPDTNIRSVEFSTNGNKMFVIGRNTDKVYQYSVENAFDITTGTILLTNEFDLSSFSLNNPLGLTFSNDGSQMFVLDSVLSTVFQFTLPSPFQL